MGILSCSSCSKDGPSNKLNEIDQHFNIDSTSIHTLVAIFGACVISSNLVIFKDVR